MELLRLGRDPEQNTSKHQILSTQVRSTADQASVTLQYPFEGTKPMAVNIPACLESLLAAQVGAGDLENLVWSVLFHHVSINSRRYYRYTYFWENNAQSPLRESLTLEDHACRSFQTSVHLFQPNQSMGDSCAFFSCPVPS